MSDLVSVIIPTYNYSRFIAMCLRSVLAQDLKSLEIIVVDDGSTDDTVSALREFRSDIVYIYQNNQGLSGARNTGLQKSTGRWVVFLDSDDILGQGVLKSHLGFVERNPDAGMVVCPNRLFRHTDLNGMPIISGEWPLYRDNLEVHLCHFNIAPPHAFFIRRDIFETVGEFDRNLKACEDYDMWLRIVAKGYLPSSNYEGLVFYRRHQHSMSANQRNQFHHDQILHQRLSALLKDNPYFPSKLRLQSILAFVSGAVLTAMRLSVLKMPDAKLALQHARERMIEIEDHGINPEKEWDILSKLFVYRILCYSHLPSVRGLPESKEIRSCLLTILNKAGVCNSNLHLMTEAVLSWRRESDLNALEARQLRYLGLALIAEPFDSIYRVFEQRLFRV